MIILTKKYFYIEVALRKSYLRIYTIKSNIIFTYYNKSPTRFSLGGFERFVHKCYMILPKITKIYK